MREDDGRKLDHQTLEALRLRAVEQVARGVSAAEVGAGLAALGLHRRTSYTWLAKERTEGRRALRAKPVPGRAGPVFCIVDNHQPTGPRPVDRYVDSTDGALRLYRAAGVLPTAQP